MATLTAPIAASHLEVIRQAAHPLTRAETDYDLLMETIGDSHFVLLGEASHGTHEFYRERARITRHLIEENGFTAVAVEADWPDAYRVNSYVRGRSEDATADEALSSLKRFPTWMWRNHDVLDFVEGLKRWNDSRPESVHVGFYGLDLYSLSASIEAVLSYLDRVDPEAARRARYRYSCFDHFGEDSQAYGYAASFGFTEPCEQEVVEQLVELQRSAAGYRRKEMSEDDHFFAEQNARVVKNAEEYYRTMFRGQVPSWNLRDRHMAQTLEELVAHLERRREDVKVVVWEHNSHLGDARATDMSRRGELNVGQLVRERHGRDAVLVGFSTYAGTVTAATYWDEPAQRRRVRPALDESYEALLHELSSPRNFLLILRDGGELSDRLREPRLERAIGVIYRPETERLSHYFLARLSDQFDAVLHFDHTQAVEPLEPTDLWRAGEETPETFPVGL